MALCLLFVAIACARIIATYGALSLTYDEAFHFACGIRYLSNQGLMEVENPPVTRAMMALPAYEAGVRPAGLDAPYSEGLALLARSGNFDRTVFLMRLGNLPFFLMACFAVAAWSWHWYSKPEAVIAVALFTLLPTVLADAGLFTTDMSVGATVTAAFVAAMFWAERPTVPRAILVAFCAALAFQSKYTSLGYLTLSTALSLLCCAVSAKHPNWRSFRQWAGQRLPTFLLATLTLGCLLWGCYRFSFGPVVSRRLGISTLPAPEFFAGLQRVAQHVARGHPAFLLGRISSTGWWYYYPVALLVKLPIAFLLLAALGLYVCIRRWARPAYLFPLAFCAGILLPAMASRIDIGVRHIEPIYAGLALIAALGMVRLLQWERFGVATAGVLFLWMIISVALHHPDYLAYFNGFAGKHPENVLVDSNYDWGQDLKFLAKRLHELGVEEVSMAVLDEVKRYDYMQAWYGLPKIKPLDPVRPAAGWNVVSVTVDKALRKDILNGKTDVIPWYDQMPPTERVGTFLLYYIAPGTESPVPPL